jgi:hypothetical protein
MNEQNTTPPPVNRRYPGTLAFYHPNSAGTGSAVRFELKPALGNREGCFFMELARQKTAAARDGNGARQAATFDWAEKVTVKLGVGDVCSLLLVLRGRQEEAGNGKGLFHDTAEATTVIRLRRGGAEFQGTALEVSRKAKRGGAEPVRLRLVLTEAEALGLEAVFEQSLLLLVYGVLTPEEPAPAACQLHGKAGDI